jgi:hypothetical protein
MLLDVVQVKTTLNEQGGFVMSIAVNVLLEQAKGLPEQDKLALLDGLFNLVSPSDPAIEQAWLAECKQRAAAIDSGAMALLDANDVMMKYRQ